MTEQMYVVMPEFQGEAENYYPFFYLVLARDEDHAIERVTGQTGKDLSNPAVMTLDSYYRARQVGEEDLSG